MLGELFRLRLIAAAISLRVVLLGGCTGLLLYGCFTPTDSASPQLHVQPDEREKNAAAADCDQEIEALKQFVANQETKPCVKEKIIQPLTGICATNGLSRECISRLDEGTSCLANGPQLPDCNRLAKMENQFQQLGAFRLEEVGTTIHENDQ